MNNAAAEPLIQMEGNIRLGAVRVDLQANPNIEGRVQKKTMWWFAVLAVLAAPDGAQAETHPLFIIERSKNANVVHYDARLTADGKLDPKEPVIAYCVMLAEDGRRKELNWIEKKMAYGFDIKPDPSVSGYKMTMVADPQRPITVKKEGNAVRAEVVIDGRPAVFEKMYINASDGLDGAQSPLYRAVRKRSADGREALRKDRAECVIVSNFLLSCRRATDEAKNEYLWNPLLADVLISKMAILYTTSHLFSDDKWRRSGSPVKRKDCETPDE